MGGRWNHWSIDVDIGIRVVIVVLNNLRSGSILAVLIHAL